MSTYTDYELIQMQRHAEQQVQREWFLSSHPEYCKPAPNPAPAQLTDIECAAMDETIDGVLA